MDKEMSRHLKSFLLTTNFCRYLKKIYNSVMQCKFDGLFRQ